MEEIDINDIFFSSRIRRKYDVCQVNEELFFPIRKFLDTEPEVQKSTNLIPKVFIPSGSTTLLSSASLILPSNIPSASLILPSNIPSASLILPSNISLPSNILLSNISLPSNIPLPANIPSVSLVLPSNIPLPTNIPSVSLPANIPLPTNIPSVSLPAIIPSVSLPAIIPSASLPAIIPSASLPAKTQSTTLTQNVENAKERTLGYDILEVKYCKSYQCPKCKQKASFHPDFVEANLQGCIKCEGAEVLGKRLCEFRGFIFVRAFFKNDHMLEYKCKEGESGHTCETRLCEFRRGRGCSSCRRDSKRKPAREKIITDCDCREKGKCFKTEKGYLLCKHYNFATVYPKLAEDWDYDLNKGVSPYKIPPSCDKEYFFTCKKFNISYPHCIMSRVNNNILCPYCSGHKVCDGNCLLATHPELCKEWDYEENKILPTEITAGCDYLASWICREKTEKFINIKEEFLKELALARWVVVNVTGKATTKLLVVMTFSSLSVIRFTTINTVIQKDMSICLLK